MDPAEEPVNRIRRHLPPRSERASAAAVASALANLRRFDPPIPVDVAAPGSIFHGHGGVAVGVREFGGSARDYLVETIGPYGRARLGFSRTELVGALP